MIVDLLIDALTEFVVFVFELFPELPDPSPLVAGAQSGVASIVSMVGSLGFWVPFGAAGTAAGVVGVVVVAAFGIKLVRIVASFLTMGGGSAA